LRHEQRINGKKTPRAMMDSGRHHRDSGTETVLNVENPKGSAKALREMGKITIWVWGLGTGWQNRANWE